MMSCLTSRRTSSHCSVPGADADEAAWPLLGGDDGDELCLCSMCLSEPAGQPCEEQLVSCAGAGLRGQCLRR